MSGGKPGVEAAKWLAFALMIGDHVNLYLLGGAYPVLYLLGRLVFPLFAFALAEGLAGGGELRAQGVLKRLVLWACIAQVPWSAFSHSVGLNVLFALAAGLCGYLAVFGGGALWKRALMGTLGIAVSVAAEFGIAGFCVVFFSMCRREKPDHRGYLVAYLLALAALYAVNKTWFALAVPLVIRGLQYIGELPRVRHLFYWMYPAHFVALAFARYAL